MIINSQPTVADIDAVKREFFDRSPDRPSGRLRVREKQSPELRKAKSRLRTAAWRKNLDRNGRPESDTVAIQFLASLIEVARESGHAVQDLPETKMAFDRMFDALTLRGFQRQQVEAVVKRIARR